MVESTNLPTTNRPPRQLRAQTYFYPGGSEDMTVIERFTRVDENTGNYALSNVLSGARYQERLDAQDPTGRR